MKTIENQGFLTTLNAMGRSVSVETPAAFQKANKINGFVHISYGTALKPKPKIPPPRRGGIFRPLPEDFAPSACVRRKKRQRAAAVQDAPRGTMMIEQRAASWTAPALWSFVKPTPSPAILL